MDSEERWSSKEGDFAQVRCQASTSVTLLPSQVRGKHRRHASILPSLFHSLDESVILRREIVRRSESLSGPLVSSPVSVAPSTRACPGAPAIGSAMAPGNHQGIIYFPILNSTRLRSIGLGGGLPARSAFLRDRLGARCSNWYTLKH